MPEIPRMFRIGFDIALAAILLIAPTLIADTPRSNSVPAARVLVAGDSRGKPGMVEILKAARQATSDQPVSALITPGDMDPFATTVGQLAAAFGPPTPGTAEAGKGLIWYPVVGNHEATSDRQTMIDFRSYYQQHLAAITTAGPAGTKESTYSFDLGSIHFAILNEYWNGKTTAGSDTAVRDAVVPELRDWLEQDLKASKKPFKIVVGHEPAYPQGDQDFHEIRHADTSLNAHVEQRDALWKTLEDQNVAILLVGHTHRYSRYRPAGSKVWQLDGAQARNDDSWKYDAFIILTATDDSLRSDVYRHLTNRDHWSMTDSFTLDAQRSVISSMPPATQSEK